MNKGKHMTSMSNNKINNDISKKLLVNEDIKLSEYVLKRADDMWSLTPREINATLRIQLKGLISDLDVWDAMSDENREDMYCKVVAEQSNDQKTPERKKYDEYVKLLNEVQSTDGDFSSLSEFIDYDVLGPLRGYASDNGLFVDDDIISLSFDEFCVKTRDDILSDIATKEFEVGVDAVNVERANKWIDSLYKFVRKLEMD